MVKYILTSCVFLLSFLMDAQEPIDVKWEDLAPEASYEDPYKKLTYDQLYDLRKVADIRQWEVEKNELVTPEVSKENDSLELVLSQQGLNVDYLLAGAIAITIWIGLGFLLFGLVNISLALRLRKLNAAVK